MTVLQGRAWAKFSHGWLCPGGSEGTRPCLVSRFLTCIFFALQSCTADNEYGGWTLLEHTGNNQSLGVHGFQELCTLMLHPPLAGRRGPAWTRQGPLLPFLSAQISGHYPRKSVSIVIPWTLWILSFT